MPNPSKRKGSDFERMIVNWHRERGIKSSRIPLSGALKGEYACDLRIGDLTVEAKKRKDGSGFKTLYGFFDQDDADIVVVGMDRRRPVYCISEATWEKLIERIDWEND